MSREEYIQLAESCNFLEHYQREHARFYPDKVTKFRGKRIDGVGVDIYVVSDSEWKRRMEDFTKPAMEPTQRRRLKTSSP